MLRKGYYLTKGGYHARIDNDISGDRGGLGVIREVGYVSYQATGEFSFKDEAYEAHPGDKLDLLVETWQSRPFQEVNS